MTRTATDKEVSQISLMISSVMEPKIQALVEEFNKLLQPRGLRTGVELQWFIEGTEDNEKIITTPEQRGRKH